MEVEQVLLNIPFDVREVREEGGLRCETQGDDAVVDEEPWPVASPKGHLLDERGMEAEALEVLFSY